MTRSLLRSRHAGSGSGLRASYAVTRFLAQAATGITHVEELVASFVSAEDHNFSMFNYVNELNQEAEKLEEQAAELQQEIARHTGAGVSENSFRKRLVQARARAPVLKLQCAGC